jgi:hypothetical protein
MTDIDLSSGNAEAFPVKPSKRTYHTATTVGALVSIFGEKKFSVCVNEMLYF